MRKKDTDKQLRSLIEAAPSSINVVDIGCGTGTWLATQIAANPISLVAWYGVDPSAEMLGRAREKSDLVKWVQASCDHLPFEDSFFDYVSSQYAYHHFPNKFEAFKEMGRVTRNEGKIVLKNHDPYSCSYNLTNRFFPNLTSTNLKRFPTLAQIEEMLGSVGFKNIDVIKKEYACNKVLNLSEYVEVIKKRTISDLWLISDEEYTHGVNEIDLWLKDRADDLHALHASERTVQIQISAVKSAEFRR